MHTILLTGAKGFFGQAILKALSQEKGYRIKTADHKTYDLSKIDRAMAACKNVDIVIHAAGLVLSRIEQNLRPSEVIFQNVVPAINIAEAAKAQGVKKLIFISSITAYPKSSKALKEEDLWKGSPQGDMPYGYAKRMADIIATAYSKAYGIKTCCAIFPNLYGPHDKYNFNPPPLVASAVKQLSVAKRKKLKEFFAGDNGHMPIDLLYIDDAAQAIKLLLKQASPPSLINIGTGKSVKIAQVFALVAKNLGFNGKITWKASKAKVTDERCLNVDLMKKALKWRPKVDLALGVKLTVKDFLKQS